MDNNVNPNENLEQDTSSVSNDDIVQNVPVNDSSSSIPVTTTSTLQPEAENKVDDNKKDDRFSLFKQQENKSTPVVMSKQMAAKLEAEQRSKREAKETYVPKPVSKAKYVSMIIFFVFMFALIYFLPDITNYVTIKKAVKEQESAPVITTGTLNCKLNRTTEKFNISYTAQFGFTDSKLDRLTYVTSTTGDSIIDAYELDELMNKCRALQGEVSSLAGVKVSCSQSEGSVVETQNFVYASINKESVNSAYIEAGGVYPEFDNGQDIDVIEKNMSASGYMCERTE